MKWNLVALLAIGLVSLPSVAQSDDTNLSAQVYPATEDRPLAGATHSISGAVAQVTSKEVVPYQNLDEAHPDTPSASLIFTAKTNLFGDLKKLKGKTVLLTGKVTTDASTPQIVIEGTEQLKVVAELPRTEQADASNGTNSERLSVSTTPRPVAPEQPTVWFPQTTAPERVVMAGSSLAVWCLVGSLLIMTGMLAWLIVLLRRSGLGAARIPMSLALAPVPRGSLSLAAAPDYTPATTNAASPSGTDLVRQQAVAELAEFAKQSLVQELYSQRQALADIQQQAQRQLAALEERLTALHLPLQQRIRAYEARIAELEKELDTRDTEVRELVQAALLLTRQRLENTKEPTSSRLN